MTDHLENAAIHHDCLEIIKKLEKEINQFKKDNVRMAGASLHCQKCCDSSSCTYNCKGNK